MNSVSSLAALGIPYGLLVLLLAMAALRGPSPVLAFLALVACGLPLPFVIAWHVSRTEQARLDRALAREQELRDLLENLPHLAWITDPGGSLEWMNGRWEEYTGLARDALLGENRWRVTLHPDDVERCLAPWSEALRGGHAYECEYRLRRADGSYRWHLVRAHAERDAAGRVVRWVGTCTDIQAQKEAEAAVQTIADRFRHLALATSQVVWTAKPDGTMAEDSPSWLAFTGQTSEQAAGTGFWDAIHPEDRESVQGRWQQALRTRRPHEAEVRVRRADGTWVPTLIRGVPVFAPDGSLREWIGANTDITHRKAAEQQLLEDSRRKDEFLAMLGHELRNPLAPILTAVAVLKRTDAERLQVEVIERQVLHMARLVDDLLDVSRISRGRVQLEREPLETVEVVQRAIESARPLIDSRRHSLVVDVPTSGLAVYADRVRLSQVISNLLSNSAKYTDPGGTLTVSARRETAGEIVIRVQDTGIGIEPALLPNVFDLFVQGSRSLDREAGGLGIGLTIVRRLVEMHGGTISAFSEGEGRGSEFVVRLPTLAASGVRVPPRGSRRQRPLRRTPARRPLARVGAEPEPQPRAPDRGLRVLVVDDNVDAALTIEAFLSMADMTVDVAHDGTTALAVAERSPPDVVLLDIGLPGIDGYEIARRMRADPVLAPARLIALTGYGQEKDRARALASGFEAHLVKPVSGEALLGEILAGQTRGVRRR